jgi:hypothetical protein
MIMMLTMTKGRVMMNMILMMSMIKDDDDVSV